VRKLHIFISIATTSDSPVVTAESKTTADHVTRTHRNIVKDRNARLYVNFVLPAMISNLCHQLLLDPASF